MQASKDFPDSFYRVTVKGLCVRDGKILLMRESETHSGQCWELPGGGLDFGEDIRAGFQREVQEETGLKVIHMSKTPIYVWTYKFSKKRNMDWYYSLVLAYHIDFESLNFKPSNECEQIAFFSKEELADLKLGDQMGPLLHHFNPEDFNNANLS